MTASPPTYAQEMLFNTNQVIEVFVISADGVSGALIEQIRSQHAQLKDEHIDLLICRITNSRTLLTNVHGIDLTNSIGCWRRRASRSTVIADQAGERVLPA